MNMTYEKCRLCPRECGVNRTAGELGFCGCPDTALVAKTMLHKWEEPVLAGSGGSGAIFSVAAPCGAATARMPPSAVGRWASPLTAPGCDR